MTDEEIHNIWLHMSGKAEGLLEAGGSADLPVLFANAILEYNKRTWVGLTSADWNDFNAVRSNDPQYVAAWAEAKLRNKNT